MFWCQKGCDFAKGRNVDPLLRLAQPHHKFDNNPNYRKEAENMCKMMATSTYALQEHEDLGI